jgi:hypothetical protein
MCGNVVTLYQLQVSSRQDIETALGAKVGILAHNTNVQPGASVPFMVVFFGTPETVEEFGLDVVQSQFRNSTCAPIHAGRLRPAFFLGHETKIAYVCSACKAVSVRWQGQCPQCHAWNTLELAPEGILGARV